MPTLLLIVWFYTLGGMQNLADTSGTSMLAKGDSMLDVRPPASVPGSAFSDASTSLRFRHLTAIEGLPSSTVHHVMQDRRGFIWLSTRRGVLRYDGRSFVTFQHNPLDANSVSANTIWATAEDQRGWIWMGTLGGGLSIYRPARDRFVRIAADSTDATALQANTVTALHEDQQGRMWVGTDGGGLSQAEVYAEHDSVRVTFRTVQRGDASASLARARVLDIAETQSGVLWLATYGDGVHRYNPATDSIRTFQQDPARP